jgi:hypothetical protein
MCAQPRVIALGTSLMVNRDPPSKKSKYSSSQAVRYGEGSAIQFRSASNSGRSQRASACLKGAISDSCTAASVINQLDG